MRIPPHAVEEFKAIYKKRFGGELTDAEALEKSFRLVRLMELVYKPMTKEDLGMVKKRQVELGIRKTEEK